MISIILVVLVSAAHCWLIVRRTQVEKRKGTIVFLISLLLSASLFLFPRSDNRADGGAHHMNINATMFQQDAR